MPGILFVCTANICRSPMAAGIFKKLIQDRAEGEEWRVESAGTWGLDGEEASLGSQTVMSEMGVDLSGHIARRVTSEMLAPFDLILTMESGHKEALQIEFSEIADKVFMLSEMSGEILNIEDPIGRTYQDYLETVDQIDKLIESGFPRILRLLDLSN